MRQLHRCAQLISKAHMAVLLVVQNSVKTVHNRTFFSAVKKQALLFPQIHSPNSNRVYLKNRLLYIITWNQKC